MTHLPIAIDPRHPAFDGHFPSRPIVPGVVLLDCSLRAIAAHRGDAPAAVRIGVAKFLSMVVPGERVRLELEESPDGYRLRILAGPPDRERVAVSGNLQFERAPRD